MQSSNHDNGQGRGRTRRIKTSLISQRFFPLIQRIVPPALRQDSTLMTRTENLIAAMALAVLVVPGYGLFYLWQEHTANAISCFAASAAVLASLVLLRLTGRLSLARDFLILSIYLLLLVLTYRLDGMAAPTVVWLAVCPLIATAAGGRIPGFSWSAIVLCTIVGIYACDALGLFPPSTYHNLRALEAISTISFVVTVAIFLVLFERISATAIFRLDQALSVINELAIRDDLTGVFNRRELIRIAEQEKSRAERQRTQFCVCLIDLDHFKSVNDTYGHAAGDMVLKAVAGRIQDEIRNIDCFGRYGGEEFLLLLVGTDADSAQLLVDRVRKQVEGLALPEVMNGHHVTVSIGVAQYDGAESIEHLLSRADHALYAAKRSGRNRVAVARDAEMSGAFAT